MSGIATAVYLIVAYYFYDLFSFKQLVNAFHLRNKDRMYPHCEIGDYEGLFSELNYSLCCCSRNLLPIYGSHGQDEVQRDWTTSRCWTRPKYGRWCRRVRIFFHLLYVMQKVKLPNLPPSLHSESVKL